MQYTNSPSSVESRRWSPRQFICGSDSRAELNGSINFRHGPVRPGSTHPVSHNGWIVRSCQMVEKPPLVGLAFIGPRPSLGFKSLIMTDSAYRGSAIVGDSAHARCRETIGRSAVAMRYLG